MPEGVTLVSPGGITHEHVSTTEWGELTPPTAGLWGPGETHPRAHVELEDRAVLEGYIEMKHGKTVNTGDVVAHLPASLTDVFAVGTPPQGERERILPAIARISEVWTFVPIRLFKTEGIWVLAYLGPTLLGHTEEEQGDTLWFDGVTWTLAEPMTAAPLGPVTITGTPEPGQILKAVAGTWSPLEPESVAFEWYYADEEGQPEGEALGTEADYEVTVADVGKALVVREVPTWAPYKVIAATQLSAATEPVEAPGVPVNEVLPAITGTPKVGETLTAGTGTWSESPESYEYKWFLNEVEVPEATEATLVAAGEPGDEYAVQVTAVNMAGSSAPAESAPVVIVE